MLKVNNICKSYGTVKAVDGLSFEVKPGEIFGLLGINGSGKTTTFRVIMGLLEADNGKVELNGRKIDYSVTDEIGFLTEERSLMTKLTVKQQVLYYGILKGMTEEEILKKLDYYLERFKITEYKERKIKELSKGNQQKIQFITAIMNDPKLLILDEPFSGLDPINAEQFKQVILDLKKKGSMIIMSSHQMNQVEEFCEKIVILIKGKAVLEGYLKDIKDNFKRKNIVVIGDVNENELSKIEGVMSVNRRNEDYLITISDLKYAQNVFEYISKCSNIVKYEIEQPSLNEIFIEKVGESYES